MLPQHYHEISLGSEAVLLFVSDAPSRTHYIWDEQRHCNADWEFHFICKGLCTVDIEDQHCCLQAGQALLIPPGIYHRPKAQPGEFERFTLSFSLQKGPLYELLTQRVPTGTVIQASKAIYDSIGRILEEGKNPQFFSSIYLHSCLTCLTVEILRYFNISDTPSGSEENNTSYHLTRQIDAYFEQHFADPAGEAVLAAQLHVSRRQLLRILQAYYGMSFRKKVIHARMDYAALLLRTTSMKISQISTAVGYSSEATFFKVFRRSFSVTPRQYRARYNK